MVILYRPNSEHGRAIETFIHDFKAVHTTTRLEVVNVDGREGVAMASLYDVMRFPTILAVANDGSLLKHWEGDTLPLMNEVASYVFSY